MQVGFVLPDLPDPSAYKVTAKLMRVFRSRTISEMYSQPYASQRLTNSRRRVPMSPDLVQRANQSALLTCSRYPLTATHCVVTV